LTELLSKPSVLLTVWFLMLVVTLLPSWSVLSELVEPRAVRATSIKNQAINKTEGLLNNSVNEFLNAFGAGRSEVSIGGISTKKLTYSLKASLLDFWALSTEKALKENVIKRLSVRKCLN
jgi:hypothetical protein